MFFGIEESKVARVDVETDVGTLAGLQEDLGEALQFFGRPVNGGFFISNIKLDNFGAGHIARISHGKGDGKAFPGLGVRTYVCGPETGSCERFRTQARFAEFEGGIAEAVAEGKTRRGALGIIPTVSHVHAFGVVFVQEVGVFPGIS